VIWVHCGDATEVETTLSLATRLKEQISEGRILITAMPDVLPDLSALPGRLEAVEVPADTVPRARSFLDQWQPACVLWIGGTLRPVLLRCVEDRNLPATLINARNLGNFGRAIKWLPRAGRNTVSSFQKILTVDGATATRLMKGGVQRDCVQATGPILAEPTPLPHDQYELAVMSEALGARPLWFASAVCEGEIADIATAHVAASRKSHRLLLVLTPRDIEAGIQAGEVLQRAGLQVGIRSNGDDPEPEHQAYVADLPDEAGLWYRLAPLTFLGGTMSGDSSISPFDPIMLGSAVVHGTNQTPFEARFARLAKAEACREGRSVDEPGVAVGALIFP